MLLVVEIDASAGSRYRCSCCRDRRCWVQGQMVGKMLLGVEIDAAGCRQMEGKMLLVIKIDAAGCGSAVDAAVCSDGFRD